MGLLKIVLVAALYTAAIAEVAVIFTCPNAVWGQGARLTESHAPQRSCEEAGIEEDDLLPESIDVPASACEVSEVRITPCKKSPCNLIKGKNASLSFDFTPNFAAEKMKTKVYWANNALDVPFEGFGSDDACIYTTCPSQVGQMQTLDYHLHISKMLPQGTFRFKWVVWNEKDESQSCCFMTNIKLSKK